MVSPYGAEVGESSAPSVVGTGGCSLREGEGEGEAEFCNDCGDVTGSGCHGAGELSKVLWLAGLPSLVLLE